MEEGAVNRGRSTKIFDLSFSIFTIVRAWSIRAPSGSAVALFGSVRQLTCSAIRRLLYLPLGYSRFISLYIRCHYGSEKLVAVIHHYVANEIP